MRTRLATIALVAVALLASAEEKERPLPPFLKLPTYRLHGFIHPHLGDLGGKRLNDIVKESDVVKAVVLANNTSMPDSGHLGGIGMLLRTNPEILPLSRKDEKGTVHRLDKFDTSSAFFSALLVTEKGDYVGFHVNREAVRIVAGDGDGYVLRK